MKIDKIAYYECFKCGKIGGSPPGLSAMKNHYYAFRMADLKENRFSRGGLSSQKITLRKEGFIRVRGGDHGVKRGAGGGKWCMNDTGDHYCSEPEQSSRHNRCPVAIGIGLRAPLVLFQ
ncbi:MAG: hypothetical protein WCH85_06070 [Methanomicrobiales archaeon]